MVAPRKQRQVNLWDWDQPALHSLFQDSQGYLDKPCLGKKTKTQKYVVI